MWKFVEIKVYPRFLLSDNPLEDDAIFEVKFTCEKCGKELIIRENDLGKITDIFDKEDWGWIPDVGEYRNNVYCSECKYDIIDEIWQKEKDEEEHFRQMMAETGGVV